MSGKGRDGRKYTDREAAEALGVSERTVRTWRVRGWVVNRPDGTLDVPATASRVQAHRDPTLGGKPDRGVGGAPPVQPIAHSRPAPSSPSAPRLRDTGAGTSSDATRLLQARALKETLAGKALRLAIEEREGRLIDRREAERVFVEAVTEARSCLEAIPGRVYSRLVGLEARAIQEILREEIEMALRSVSRVPDIGPNEGGVS